ncbi:MAG: hypothetical protein QW759_01960, partial [Candidatus Micrarchaeaceae archaeon]
LGLGGTASPSQSNTAHNQSKSAPLLSQSSSPCLINAPAGYCGYAACPSGYVCGNPNGERVSETSSGQCALGGTGYAVGTYVQSSNSGGDTNLAGNYIYCVGTDNPGNTTQVYYAPISSTGIGPWLSTMSYPVPIYDAGCSTYNGYIYCVGTGSFDSSNQVYYAPISTAGVGAWQTWQSTTSYPIDMFGAGCSIYNGYIYCVGTFSTTSDNQAYYAPISSTGIGPWLSTMSYPTALFGTGCYADSGYIYCVGTGGVSSSTLAYYAPISSTGIGPWQSTTSYPVPMAYAGCSIYNGYIYCVGTEDASPYTYVYYAPISSTGIGPWQSTANYPVPIYDAGCSTYNGYIYCVGTGSFDSSNQVYYAPISSTGIGPWQSTTSYPVKMYDAYCTIPGTTGGYYGGGESLEVAKTTPKPSPSTYNHCIGGTTSSGVNFEDCYLYDNFYTYTPKEYLVSSSTGQLSNLNTSPVVAVNNYNQNNGTWFLTCPAYPEQNPRNQEYFYTGNVPYVAGAACFQGSSETKLYTQTNITTNVTWTDTTLASATVEPMNVINASAPLNISIITYSPSVDNEISSTFQTDSYVFQQLPAYVQHAMWTWHAEFANFSNMQVPASSSWSSNTLTYQYTTSDGNTCTYTYTYRENTLLTSASNYYIPFNEVLPNGQYNTFDANVVPYLLYNFSMPSINPGLTRSGSAPMLTLSYDILGPWNYYTPGNSIDMFPIDVGSRLFVNYNGVLESTPPECLSMGVGNAGNIKICPSLGGMNNGNINNFVGIPEWKSAQISGPLAVAASPNDYIYVLNYSSSANEYNISVLRLVPHGYYNTSNYQPSSVGGTTSSSAWSSEWNGYWSNVINMQDQSVYLVRSIGLNSITAGNSYTGFTPIDIAVDYNGDVFITGSAQNTSSYNYETNQYNVQTVLAEVTNTTTGPIHMSANLINPNLPVESEIAVSPTGGIVFLANKTSGYIQTFNGANFTPIGAIDLSYNKYIGSNEVAELNISSYLANGGLDNQSMPWIPQIFQSWGLNQNFEIDDPIYHHPLAIQDINGYLYVLDQWTGGLGVKGPISISSQCTWGVCNERDSGIFFNMLVLRVMNNTGYDVPINPTNFDDMVQQVKCMTPADMNNICTTISQTEANSKCSDYNTNSECTALLVSSCTRTPGSTYECVGPAKTTNAFYATSTLNLSGEYPPYGWVLSANVTAANFSCSPTGSGGLPWCGSHTRNLTQSPDSISLSIITQPGNYHGGFPPIGPPLNFANMTNYNQKSKQAQYNLANVSSISLSPQPSGHLRFDYSYLLSGVGFSANYNNTIYILIPSTNSIYSQS